jgi:restriction system protein
MTLPIPDLNRGGWNWEFRSFDAKLFEEPRSNFVNLQLFGTMDHGATSAMLVTSFRFTKGARQFQPRHEYQLSLKEYNNVVEWIQKYKTRKLSL